MMESGQLCSIKTLYNGRNHIRYIPLMRSNLTALKASEVDVIDDVIQQFSNLDPSSFSHYVCQDLPWLATKERGEIDYELAFYRGTPFSVRRYESE